MLIKQRELDINISPLGLKYQQKYSSEWINFPLGNLAIYPLTGNPMPKTNMFYGYKFPLGILMNEF